MIYNADGYFMYAGETPIAFGGRSFYCNTMSRPKRDVEAVVVPGRNGEVLLDNGRYENVDRIYQVQVLGSYSKPAIDRARDLMSWLLSKTGYNRLTDTYEPDYYMKARVVSVEMTRMTRDAVSLRITFNRMPQMFLLSGEEEIQVASGDTIRNETLFRALPVIIATTSSEDVGAINFSNSLVYVEGWEGDIYIDSDLQIAYNSSTNLNDKIRVASGSFPYLAPGYTTISYSGSVSGISIIPGWWEL